VLGHRGSRLRARENTLPAFELALSEGADGVELDVRLDGDGNVVVLHDRRLDRMTAGVDERDVEAIPTAALARVDLGGGARIPELGEVLAWARARSTRLNIELKADVSAPQRLVAGVVALIRGMAREQLLISSFHPLLVRRVAEALPGLPSGVLIHPRDRRMPNWRRLGAAGVHPHWSSIDAGRMERWAAEGALVNSWTVNDVAEARRLAALGVDALITDDPRALLAEL
jgi:glycerophosphoryl diester phosphodiesterase